MEFKYNYFLFSTSLLLSLAGFIHLQDLTYGEVGCFVDMLVLHYPYANQLKMVMKIGAFVLPNSALPQEENMNVFLDGDSSRSEELKKCIKKHKKGLIKKIFRQEIKINLMAIYKKIYRHHKILLTVSKELRAKFHNAQCFIDLMVLEGKKKIYSTSEIESNLVTELLAGKIKVGEHGATFLRSCIGDHMKFVATFLRSCIWDHMKFVMHIDGHRILRLNDGTHDDFLKTLKRTPHPEQLILEIEKELHCVAKNLVENLLVSTRDGRITASALTRIHQSHGELFYKLKQCIYRKDAFLKGDGHGIHEYVDIQAILAQGFVLVPDELKQELGLLQCIQLARHVDMI